MRWRCIIERKDGKMERKMERWKDGRRRGKLRRRRGGFSIAIIDEPGVCRYHTVYIHICMVP